MNKLEMDKKCKQYIDRVNEFKDVTKLRYEMKSSGMVMCDLYGKDEIGRIIFAARYDSNKELFQFLRGMLHVLEV